MPRFDLHGLVEVVRVQTFLHGCIEARPVGELDPERRDGHQGFTEGDQLRPTDGRAVYGGDHVGEARRCSPMRLPCVRWYRTGEHYRALSENPGPFRA